VSTAAGLRFFPDEGKISAMTFIPSRPVLQGILILAALQTVSGQIELGDPPLPPTDLSNLPRLMQPAGLATAGFTVNTASRESVRTFYNAVYMASENVPMESTANTANCIPGTTSADFKDAVVRRVNWYRAMAGIPANVVLNQVNNAKNQQAALIMSRNNSLSHYPPNTWYCWTSEGYEAAGNSNIGIGTSGPETITAYMRDHGSGNSAVGHRRWLLYPQTQIMGTGDVPTQSSYSKANAVWVMDGHYTDPRPSTRTAYVAWPPAGHVPFQTVFPRWSFSYPGATFSGAAVTMLSNGVPVSVVQEAVANGYGENTIVWIPMGLDALSWSTTWPFSGQDTVYTVTIANALLNSKTTNFTYSTTVFDPALAGSDASPPVISGPAQPSVGLPNSYTFTPVLGATSYQWRSIMLAPFSLNDGGENGLANFTVETGSYSVIASSPVASGTSAFQLGHVGGGLSPQLLTLKTPLLVKSDTLLSFKSQLKAATDYQVARVQLSVNDSQWFDIYSQPGNDQPGESSWSLRSLPLGAYSGSTARIRFNYDFTYGSYFLGADATTGWHIDEITINSAKQSQQTTTNSTLSTQFQFTPAQAAEYSLQVRAFIFSDFPLEWGPSKTVASSSASPTVIQLQHFAFSNSVCRIAFSLASGSANSFRLLQATNLTGQWTTNTTAALKTNSPTAFEFTTSAQGAIKFYRVQSP
jgi:hypothetical protein